MSFLVPLFLAGAAAVAVPILVHLTHRERREPVRFPSLMFLRRIPFRTERRQRIRDWPLFLLRALAVILLAAAFARPFLPGAGFDAAQSGTAREVVIVLDRSYSMEYGDRWRRAVAAADSAVGSLGRDDRTTLVLFSDRAEAATQPTSEPADLSAVLRGVTPEPRVTRFAPALQLARDIVAGSERRARVVLLITDLQRAGWRAEGDVRLPDGTRFTVADVNVDDVPANVTVTDVVVEYGESGRARTTLSVRLAAAGGDADDVVVTLALGGERVREQRATVPAGGAALVRFDDLPATERTVRGRVHVASGDRLARDDAYHFMLRPPSPVRVLLVEDPRATTDEMVFLRRALAIGRRPPFDVARRQGAIRATDLADRDVVILNDVAPRGDVAALRRFVEAGGGLLVVAGPRGAGESALLRGVLRGDLGDVVDRLGGSGGTLTITSYDHPVFAPFRAPRSGDFSSLRILRYRRLAPDSQAAVLARFDDGSPALVEGRVGEGRVAVWASDFQNRWSDLPVRPVFLPLVHRSTLHLAAYGEPRPAYTAGTSLDLSALPEAEALVTGVADDELVVEAPSGERTALQPDERIVSLGETGFYAIRPVAGRATAALDIAVNPALEESNLAALDRAELEAAVRPLNDAPPTTAGVAVSLSQADRERRQGIWWYLLIAVTLLLVAEGVTAHFSQTRR